MRKLTLTVPFTPVSLNRWQNLHWGTKRRVKEDWDTEVAMAMMTATGMTVLKRTMERARVRIKYYFRTRHKRDKDNYTPKVIMDCLKGRVIEDDSSDRIDLDWELLFSKKQPRTEILIEELNENP